MLTHPVLVRSPWQTPLMLLALLVILPCAIAQFRETWHTKRAR